MKTHIFDLAKFLPQNTVFYLLFLVAFWQRHLYMPEMSIKFPFFKYPIQTIPRLKFSFLLKLFFIFGLKIPIKKIAQNKKQCLFSLKVSEKSFADAKVHWAEYFCNNVV
jgi:hypothetical protein